MSVYDVLIYFDTNTGPATKLTITYMNDYLNKTSIVMQMLAQDCTTVCMWHVYETFQVQKNREMMVLYLYMFACFFV